MIKLEEAAKEPEIPKLDKCICSVCDSVFWVHECIENYDYHDGWEMPAYTIHECPKCKCGGEIIDYWPSTYKKVWVDMDGVLADFEAGVIKMTGSTIEEHIEANQWQVVKSSIMNYDLFRNLPTMPLVDVLNKHPGKFGILTAIGDYNQPAVRQAKIDWLMDHIPEFNPCDFVFVKKSHEKAGYVCRKYDTVLIDDRVKSTEPFEKAGGETILYVNTDECNAAVDKLLTEIKV